MQPLHAARSGLTPLILRASNTITRFSSRSSSFCNFTPRIHQKQSQKARNPKFSWGACPQTPLAGALYIGALKSRTGTPLFKIVVLPLHQLSCPFLDSLHDPRCLYTAFTSYKNASTSTTLNTFGQHAGQTSRPTAFDVTVTMACMFYMQQISYSRGARHIPEI